MWMFAPKAPKKCLVLKVGYWGNQAKLGHHEGLTWSHLGNDPAFWQRGASTDVYPLCKGRDVLLQEIWNPSGCLMCLIWLWKRKAVKTFIKGKKMGQCKSQRVPFPVLNIFRYFFLALFFSPRLSLTVKLVWLYSICCQTSCAWQAVLPLPPAKSHQA